MVFSDRNQVLSGAASSPLHETEATASTEFQGRNGAKSSPSSRVHRRLAVTLNNAATLLHRLGEPERALRLYQECVQARMEALQSPESRNGAAPSLHLEAIEARCRAVEREEEGLRMSVSREAEPGCLDMYLRAGTRHDELDAAFLPRSSPLEIHSHPPRPSQDPTLVPTRQQDDNAASADDTRDTSVTLYNMGLTHLRSHSVAKASQLFEMALSVAPSAADPSFAARTHNAAAQARIGRGELPEAADSLSEALRLWHQATAHRAYAVDVDVGEAAQTLELGIADTLSLTGRVHFAAGNADRALELSRQALQLRRTVLGDSHVNVAATLYSIGLVLKEQGRIRDAVEHCRWFVQHAEVNANPRYRAHLAEALHALGLMCLDVNEVSQAIEAFHRAVEIRVAVHGNCHPSLADDLLQLGRVLQDLGRYREAMDRYRFTLSIETSLAEQASQALMDDDESQRNPNLQPQDSEGVATALCSIGQIHQALGENDRALRCYEEVLRISRALFGDEDEFVASMLGVIGNVCLELGETDDAAANFADAERIMRRIQSAQQEAQGLVEEERTEERMIASVPIVVPNLLQAMGIDFHPHAAAA